MIDDRSHEELERAHRWIDEQLRRLLPGWFVRLLLRTRWYWLARLTGIEIHYHRINRRPVMIVILRWGRVRAIHRCAK